jgi:hypothetical protein
MRDTGYPRLVPEVSTGPLLFERGSPVLAYWLTRAEGMTVEPLGAVVERVLVAAPLEPAEALVVRSASGRRRTISAEAIAAVEPDSGTLFLERGPTLTARTASRWQPRLVRAYVWLRPRAIAGARLTARFGRIAAVRGAAAIRWLYLRGAARISSASRNARSSDWRAFRRGSSSVS